MSTDPKPTASSIVASTATGSHLMKIDCYTSTSQVTATGTHYSSDDFSVGNHSWYLAFLPNGDCLDNADWVSFFLVLKSTPKVPVMADFSLSILDQARKPAYTKTSRIYSFDCPGSHWGFPRFIQRNALERSGLVKGDRFTVKCDIIVTVGFHMKGDEAAPPTSFVMVPPSDIYDHYKTLFLSGDYSDVKFVVDGEELRAHRCLLAARSSVFQAQFFGAMQMQEGAAVGQCVVVITDTRPDVFRNLLSFIYTDSLAGMAEREDVALMAQHLLVAADKYNVVRLKKICEGIICRCIDVNNVLSTLTLADQHGFSNLKGKCIEYLKRDGVMKVLLDTDFEHMTRSCPSLTEELIMELGRN